MADELLPSHVVFLGDRKFVGIATQAGGQTSHAAMLARSRGIPAVSGVRGLLKFVKNGDTIIVDGREGHVIINPGAEIESAYRKLQREFFDLKDQLAANARAAGRDGRRRTDRAVGQRQQSGRRRSRRRRWGPRASGFIAPSICFSRIPTCPTKRSSSTAYKKIIAASPNHRITIRTLDLGGDKTIPYLGHDREANPFMGWRSIRLSFEHPEFFATQIRAVLRAAVRAKERRPPDVSDDHDARRDPQSAENGRSGQAAVGPAEEAATATCRSA